jgi:hypothetical protein
MPGSNHRNRLEEDPVCPIEDQEDIPVIALPAVLARLERFKGCGHAVWRDALDRAYGGSYFVRKVGVTGCEGKL